MHRVRIKSLRTTEENWFTDDDRVAAIRASRRFHAQNILDWLKALEVVDPALRSEAGHVDMDCPEEYVLPLPSRLSEDKHRTYGLDAAKQMDLAFRMTQGDAVLTQARFITFEHSESLRRKDDVTGQRANTRAGKLANRWNLEKKLVIAVYNHIRQMMLNCVGGDARAISQYKELKLAHLFSKHIKPVAGKGKSQKSAETPHEQVAMNREADAEGNRWLWEIQMPGGMTNFEEELWYIESASAVPFYACFRNLSFHSEASALHDRPCCSGTSAGGEGDA